MGKRITVQNNEAKFEERILNEDNLSVLKSISKAVQKGWMEKYMKKKYKAPKTFQSRKVNQEKTCRINQENFKDTNLVEVRQLIDIFQPIYPNTIRVTKVWFLKKKEMGDGLEEFHYDYDLSSGGHNAVSSTIGVNLGVFHSEDKEEEEEEEAGNADEEDEDNEDGQVEDSNEAMNEQGDGYLPAPPMEVEGVEENTDEGQVILLGKEI
jgi:hypothetical protein